MSSNSLAARRGTALVTGGAIRVGRAIALDLARLGYDIALHYNASRAAAERTQAEIQTLGADCALFHCDLGSVPDAGVLVEQAAAWHGALKLLVNNASTYEAATIADTTPELFERQFRVNLQAPFFLIRGLARHCERGMVVNILDNKIAFNQYAFAAYLLSRKALAELTRLAALEFAPRIRVNAIAPGMVLPIESRAPAFLDWLVAGIPLRRAGNPDDLCQALRFLLASEHVTGQILTVDGGESLVQEGRHPARFADERPDPPD